MAAAFERPGTAEELADLIRDALESQRRLEIVGGGSKRAVGRPIEADASLSFETMDQVLDYQPEEMMITLQPGARLSEVEAILKARGQQFAFEPPRFGRSLEASAAESTMGGLLAAGLPGSRRFKSGGVRDHVLAVQAVNGRGEMFRAGGKVMKNVTGYDLPKLLAGSWGTLAVFTEITFRVVPAAQATCTLLFGGLDANRAVEVMGDAARGPWDITGAAWLAQSLAAAFTEPSGLQGTSITALRLEGVPGSIAARTSALLDRIGHEGARQILETDESIAFWKTIGTGAPLLQHSSAAVWRASVPPAHGARVLGDIAKRIPDSQGFLDGTGGTVWLATAATVAAAEIVRALVAESGGQALLLRAPADLRAKVAVFHPLPAPLAALTRRIKEQFDPRFILNPGRMYQEP